MSVIKLIKSFLFIASTFVLFSCSSNTVLVKTTDHFKTVTLPDSSIVYLNHNSSVEYDKTFETRNIILTGEAFFKIEKKENPFIITTEEGDIKVLGTEFNVKVSKNNFEVEVAFGTVEMLPKQTKSSQKITKGQRCEVHKNDKTNKVGKAQFEFRIWMDDLTIEIRKKDKNFKIKGHYHQQHPSGHHKHQGKKQKNGNNGRYGSGNKKSQQKGKNGKNKGKKNKHHLEKSHKEKGNNGDKGNGGTGKGNKKQ